MAWTEVNAVNGRSLSMDNASVSVLKTQPEESIDLRCMLLRGCSLLMIQFPVHAPVLRFTSHMPQPENLQKALGASRLDLF